MQSPSSARAYVGARVLLGARLVPATVVVAGTAVTEILEPSAAIGAAERIDATGLVISPGMVDTHVHGALGRNCMEGSADAIAAIAASLAHRGTTSFAAGTASVPLEQLESSLAALASRAAEPAGAGSARLLGTHLEGPFISPERSGAHRRENLTAPTAEAVGRVLDAADGSLRICTIAPELPGALDAIGRMAAAGIVPSIGHTDADYATAKRGIDAGARRATHLWSAMPAVHHRDPGAVPALLFDERVRPEVIADGVHVAPELLAAMFQNDEIAQRIMLVSDGVDVSGLPDGPQRRWEGTEVILRDGRSTTPAGVIAGSTASVLDGVRTLVAAGVPLAAALRAGSTAPADSLRHTGIGRIAVGADADLLMLDAELTIRCVLVRGDRVHDPSPQG